MTNLNRGDVVIVLFPDSDLKSFKRRPPLVVQADELETGLPQVVVAMITSNLARRGHPSRVFVPMNSDSMQGGKFRTDSVIMTDNLANIHLEAIAGKLGFLADMSLVDSGLQTTLGI